MASMQSHKKIPYPNVDSRRLTEVYLMIMEIRAAELRTAIQKKTKNSYPPLNVKSIKYYITLAPRRLA